MHVRVVILALFASSFTSCRSDSGTQPQQPPQPQSNAQFVIGLHHVMALDTILEASLSVDGTEIARFSSNVGTEPVGLQGTVRNIRSGRHTLSVVIVRQTSSPNTYLFNGSVFFEERQVFIDPFPQGTLATGEGLTAIVEL